MSSNINVVLKTMRIIGSHCNFNDGTVLCCTDTLLPEAWNLSVGLLYVCVCMDMQVNLVQVRNAIIVSMTL